MDVTPRVEPAITFTFSGVIVPCWRCHEEIELLVEEDPNEDHVCDGCAEYYGITSVGDRI